MNEDERKRRVLALVMTFPSLRSSLDLRLVDWVTFDVCRFERLIPELDARGRFAARFVLAVFDAFEYQEYFNAMEALKAWGDGDRAAYLAWAAAPWWA